MRYVTSKQLIAPSGKRRLESTILPVVPESPSDTYIQTTTPDRLDILANQFYGDVAMWWVIAAANGLGKGSFVVPANTTLRIPAKTNVMELIRTINISR